MFTLIGIFIVTWCLTGLVFISITEDREKYATVFWVTIFSLGVTFIVSGLI